MTVSGNQAPRTNAHCERLIGNEVDLAHAADAERAEDRVEVEITQQGTGDGR